MARARPGTWLLLLALSLGATACRGASADGPQSGTVRTVMTTEPSSLSLIGKSDRNSQIIASLVSDSLFKYDADLTLTPRLASSWDLSPDKRTLTVVLRDGVKWHDGVPVTARDVVYTIEKVRDPATQARSFAPQFENLESVQALDARTVRAVYTAPYADVLDSWTLPIIPEHVAGRDPDILTGAFSERPVGCGPFRLARWEHGREIVLEANPDYWDGRPHLDRIVFRILPDERTAFQALLAGDLDWMHVTPDLWREALSSTRTWRLARFVYYRLDVWYVGWNLDGSNPFFDDPRTRRALVMALDRGRFISRVLGNLARPAVGSYHPDAPWTDRALEPWPHDPVAARRLLDEAGWRDADGDGIREQRGIPFAFTLLISASTQEITDRMAAWIQQSLAAVGVKMDIEKLEWRAFQERRREHRFQAAMASLFFTPAPDQYELYHSMARSNGLNYGGVADPEIDRLLEEGRRTFDPSTRRQIYDRLQARLHELEPVSCLFYFAAPILYDARLEGIQRSPLGPWNIVPGPRQWRWIASLPGE